MNDKDLSEMKLTRLEVKEFWQVAWLTSHGFTVKVYGHRVFMQAAS